MSTATTVTSEGVGAVSQEKKTARRYVKIVDIKDAQGNITREIDESSILQETDKKEPAKIKGLDGKEIDNPHAGLPVSWANAERKGFEVFSENDVVTYNIKSVEGFNLLIPDPATQLYIIQKGLDTFQQAQLTAFFKALAENTSEPTPAYTGATLDLRIGVGEDGEYSINKTPSKRAMSDEDKLIKQLRAIGTPEDKIAAVLAVIRASSAPAVQEEEAEQEVA
jgi:hypothetical protein